MIHFFSFSTQKNGKEKKKWKSWLFVKNIHIFFVFKTAHQFFKTAQFSIFFPKKMKPLTKPLRSEFCERIYPGLNFEKNEIFVKNILYNKKMVYITHLIFCVFKKRKKQWWKIFFLFFSLFNQWNDNFLCFIIFLLYYIVFLFVVFFNWMIWIFSLFCNFCWNFIQLDVRSWNYWYYLNKFHFFHFLKIFKNSFLENNCNCIRLKWWKIK